jgi:hypothetical protein
MVEIQLVVEEHCIESEAKRVFNQLVNYLLKEDDQEKEEKLELLRRFLETANFNELRKKGLDGRERKRVVLRMKDDEVELKVLD